MKFDSPEEKYFSFYADELKMSGYIKCYTHHPEPYILSEPFSYEYNKLLKTKIKSVEQMFIRKHQYTPDFSVHWNEKARGVFFNTFKDKVNLKKIPFVAQDGKQPFSIIEIKAGFSKYNMGREAGLHQKWVMAKYGHYIQKVIISNKPNGLFAQTFTPEKYLLTEKAFKERKLHFVPKNLKDYLEI